MGRLALPELLGLLAIVVAAGKLGQPELPVVSGENDEVQAFPEFALHDLNRPRLDVVEPDLGAPNSAE